MEIFIIVKVTSRDEIELIESVWNNNKKAFEALKLHAKEANIDTHWYRIITRNVNQFKE